MDFRILGKLEVLDGDRDVAPRRQKHRALLAMFLLHPNEPISTDRLIDALWGDEPPDTAAKALHGHVSTLRKLLGPARIQTEPGGYRFELQPGELDLDRFETALRAARLIADPRERARRLADAVTAWRGDALADLRYEAFASSEVERLDELRLAALEDRIEADLAAGRHAEVLPELRKLVATNPTRERLREQQMLALYRSGRQSDALHAYQAARRHLSQELGIDPGAALRLLEQRVLAQDPGLDPPATDRPRSPRQERKSVTVVVFEVSADGGVDPEDLEAVMGPARVLVEDEMRRFGGVVQPLFANAILGIFGASRAHEDDPERAVRAALAGREAIDALGLHVHAAIESGDALVTFEGDRFDITGEVLSAANRLHIAAHANNVIVSDAVRRATESSIEYVEEGQDVWFATGRRAAHSARTNEPIPGTFVGREDELTILTSAFARAGREGRVQLATIVGEPGVGKTRLVEELRSRLVAGGVAHAWREGRCLAYGEGVTFWALGEMVKAEAGILETTDAADARAKLAAAIERLAEDDDSRAWLGTSLGALLGIGLRSAGDSGQPAIASREFLQRIAEREPLVVIFEDIHWADVALIEFITDLVAHSIGPMLVVCTARHEFLEGRPDWAAGSRSALSITLAPLAENDVSTLLTELLGQTPASDLVRRTGGNPLFAHELARRSTAGGPPPTELPESIQAVIASRLDSMPVELREAASSAAVVGEVFWAGVLVAIDGLDPAEADRRLRRLVANDVIRPARRSTVQGTQEYAFVHSLVRDAAYERLPRAERARRHLAAADWIEGLAGDRTVDHAEFLAHHTAAALELLGSTANADLVANLKARTAGFLVLAGDRAMRLDVAAAERFYQRALELQEPDGKDRPVVLVRVADAAQEGDRLQVAVGLYEEALGLLERAGEPEVIARAMNGLARACWRLGETKRHQAVVDDAILRLAALPIGPELARLWGQKARGLALAGRPAEALPWIERAAAAAELGGAPEVRMRMLTYRDLVLLELGEPVTFADSREAIRLGHETGIALETAVAYLNMASTLRFEAGPGDVENLVREAIDFSTRRGLGHMLIRARASLVALLAETGAWDEALAEADTLLNPEATDSATQVGAGLLRDVADVLVSRGLVAESEPLIREALPAARHIGDLQVLAPTLTVAARFERLRGNQAAALGLIRELEAATRSNASWRSYAIADAVRVCVDSSDLRLAERLLSTAITVPRRNLGFVLAALAALAEARGELDEALRLHTDAAELWGPFGLALEHGHALLGRGRCLTRLGRLLEARDDLRAARAIFARLGARPLLDETERWTERVKGDSRGARNADP